MATLLTEPPAPRWEIRPADAAPAGSGVPQEPVRYQRAKDEGIDVGEVRCEAVIRNSGDVGRRFAGDILPEDVRSATVSAMAGLGAIRTVIPMRLVRRLGLRHLFDQSVVLSDGSSKSIPVFSAVQIELLGRTQVELPGGAGEEVLLGQTVFEQTGILIDCKNQTLAPPPPGWAPRL